MKKIAFLLSIMVLTLSCSNATDSLSEQTDELTPVTVHVDDFSMSVETFAPRRASKTAADYTNVKGITLAFYDSEGTEVYNTTQLREDNTTYDVFGHFTCELKKGSYTMIVLGYGSKNAMKLNSMTDATFTNDFVRETFVYTRDVNITSTAAVDLSATLSRVVAQLGVISTDVRTADAVKLRTTFSAGGQGVNPMTGLSTANTGFSNTLEFNNEVGQKAAMGNFVFLKTDEQTMTVTIDVLDADDNVLNSRVVNDVPLKRNRITKLTGPIYTATASSDFVLDTDWLAETNINF